MLRRLKKRWEEFSKDDKSICPRRELQAEPPSRSVVLIEHTHKNNSLLRTRIPHMKMMCRSRVDVTFETSPPPSWSRDQKPNMFFCSPPRPSHMWREEEKSSLSLRLISERLCFEIAAGGDTFPILCMVFCLLRAWWDFFSRRAFFV